jgi:hypothetical protein
MKNVQAYNGESMAWKIVSKIVDTYELNSSDTQHEYIVYVQDAIGTNITARSAYGMQSRTAVTKQLISEYQEYGIVKIEHEE